MLKRTISVYKDMSFLIGSRNRMEILLMSLEVALMLRELDSNRNIERWGESTT